MRIALAAAALAAGLAIGVAAAAAAFPSGTSQIKDWAGVCDNTGMCTAEGFTPDDGSTAAYVRIVRLAGAEAAPKVDLAYDPGDTQPAQTWTLTVDGKPVAGIGPLAIPGGDDGARIVLNDAQAAALLAVIRDGQHIDLKAGGQTIAEISLAGSAATLLWVDAYQGRAGGVTALVDKGPSPASAVPPPMAPPLVVAAPPQSQTGVPPAAPQGLVRGEHDCDLADLPGPPDDTVARLAPGVMLWGPECAMGAYNEMNQFFLGDEHGGHIRKLSLPEPPGNATPPEAAGLLTNADFDVPSMTLSSSPKGRGIDDCGEITEWVWTGAAFALAHQVMMPACRGVISDEWPATYVTRSR